MNSQITAKRFYGLIATAYIGATSIGFAAEYSLADSSIPHEFTEQSRSLDLAHVLGPINLFDRTQAGTDQMCSPSLQNFLLLNPSDFLNLGSTGTSLWALRPLMGVVQWCQDTASLRSLRGERGIVLNAVVFGATGHWDHVSALTVSSNYD